jgi:hypothetical protein
MPSERVQRATVGRKKIGCETFRCGRGVRNGRGHLAHAGKSSFKAAAAFGQPRQQESRSHQGGAQSYNGIVRSAQLEPVQAPFFR